jgi:transposase-like protein
VSEPTVGGMESEPKRKRRRYSPAERQQLLAAWHSSGESAARFGQRHDVHASNLIRWAETSGSRSRKRAGRRAAKRGFVELRAATEHSDAHGDGQPHLEIECPNGLKLRASHPIDIEMLARLVAEVGGVPPC